MIIIRQRRPTKEYEDALVKVKEEIKKAYDEYSIVQVESEKKRKEIRDLDVRLFEEQIVLNQKSIELKGLNFLIKSRRDYHSEILAEIEQTKSKGKKDIESCKKESIAAESELEITKRQLDKAKESLKRYNGLEKRVETKQKQYSDLVIITEEKKKEIQEKENDLSAKENEVDELIKRNSVILTQTEVNKGLVEHYVKRLQRLYDKDGIKIDILKQFNIKRDNK